MRMDELDIYKNSNSAEAKWATPKLSPSDLGSQSKNIGSYTSRDYRWF